MYRFLGFRCMMSLFLLDTRQSGLQTRGWVYIQTLRSISGNWNWDNNTSPNIRSPLMTGNIYNIFENVMKLLEIVTCGLSPRYNIVIYTTLYQYLLPRLFPERKPATPRPHPWVGSFTRKVHPQHSTLIRHQFQLLLQMCLSGTNFNSFFRCDSSVTKIA